MFSRTAFAAFLLFLFSGPAAMSEEAMRVPQKPAAGAASSATADEKEMIVGRYYMGKHTYMVPSTVSRSW